MNKNPKRIIVICVSVFILVAVIFAPKISSPGGLIFGALGSGFTPVDFMDFFEQDEYSLARFRNYFGGAYWNQYEYLRSVLIKIERFDSVFQNRQSMRDRRAWAARNFVSAHIDIAENRVAVGIAEYTARQVGYFREYVVDSPSLYFWRVAGLDQPL